MPTLRFNDAAVEPLWSGLDLTIEPGEFLAILGPNGVGKSTLLTTALGTRRLTHGTVTIDGSIGYIPQQRMFEPDLAIRVRDLVELTAHSSGVGRREAKEAMAYVGAEGIMNRRVGTLSGGQQQLVRQAQAFVRNPDFLLCDEPLISLDPAAQHRTVARLDERRREHDTSIVFVTHGINPISHVCDRVLYITPFGHKIGPIEEIMTSETLSELYQTDIVVAEVNGKLVIA